MSPAYDDPEVVTTREAYEDFQEKEQKPAAKSYQFETGHWIIIAVTVGVLLYAYKTAILDGLETLAVAAGLIFLGWLILQSGRFDARRLIPVDVQLERVHQFVERLQASDMADLGKVTIHPEFRCQKVDGGKYSNDYVSLEIETIDNVAKPYMVIADPYVDGRGVIGMSKAPMGFGMPPPIKDLQSLQSITEQYAMRFGLGRHLFLGKMGRGMRGRG